MAVCDGWACEGNNESELRVSEAYIYIIKRMKHEI
jgi:hypothetical protein